MALPLVGRTPQVTRLILRFPNGRFLGNFCLEFERGFASDRQDVASQKLDTFAPTPVTQAEARVDSARSTINLNRAKKIANLNRAKKVA
jgi:hypothetical protein